VRGVTTLRLVIRYADTETNAAKRQLYARGCVWAMARLLPLVDAAPAGRGDGNTDDAVLRSVLRSETVRLAALTAMASNAAEPPVTLPLRIYVGPVAGTIPGAADSNDAKLRGLVAEMLGDASGGEHAMPVFAVVGDTGEKRRGRRRRSSDETRPEAQRDAARQAGADWLVLMALEPTTDNNADSVLAAPAVLGALAYRLTLRVVSVRDANVAALAVVDTLLPTAAIR